MSAEPTLRPERPFFSSGPTCKPPGWSLDNYPGLQGRHPSVIAGVLYRDHDLGRDDISILVIRTAEL